MATTVRVYRQEVSDYFFRLTTEAVRLFSNSVYHHTTLDQVIEQRSMHAGTLTDRYEQADMSEHLRIIPMDGIIELSFHLHENSVDLIENALAKLEKALKVPLRFGEVVSLLLFDLIVERNATELITKLGITSAEAREYRLRLKSRSASVTRAT